MASFEWKRGAMKRIRQSPEVIADLQRRANAVAEAAGPGNTTREPELTKGAGSARVAVVTSTIEAILEERRNGKLRGALIAGGD